MLTNRDQIWLGWIKKRLKRLTFSILILMEPFSPEALSILALISIIWVGVTIIFVFCTLVYLLFRYCIYHYSLRSIRSDQGSRPASGLLTKWRIMVASKMTQTDFSNRISPPPSVVEIEKKNIQPVKHESSKTNETTAQNQNENDNNIIFFGPIDGGTPYPQNVIRRDRWMKSFLWR